MDEKLDAQEIPKWREREGELFRAVHENCETFRRFFAKHLTDILFRNRNGEKLKGLLTRYTSNSLKWDRYFWVGEFNRIPDIKPW